MGCRSEHFQDLEIVCYINEIREGNSSSSNLRIRAVQAHERMALVNVWLTL